MNIDQLISPSVPTLLNEDSGSRALELMEDNKLSQLPLIAEDNYVALIQEKEVLEWPDSEAHIANTAHAATRPAILSGAHPFEAMRIMSQMGLGILPVIDHEEKYLGAVTKDTLLQYITTNSGIDMPGGIIVLEIAPRDYTLVEIARICENEDVAIMNLQVHTNELGMMEITLKVNRTSVSALVASFERHNYVVKESFGEEHKDEDIAGKYNLLMNYINM